ncbi:MAG TPA: HAD family hydrolase [Bdellovibrionales bacterium]|nr:HAD family hydrolase [Bdellovibrionales bacterium]
MKPKVLTFDIFGTVLNWREGLRRELASYGIELTPELFDEIVDIQGADEKLGFKTYSEITARSLVEACAFRREDADEISQRIGYWPLYDDSAEALEALMAKAPCVAMSNSDRLHGEQVQEQLGFRLSSWFCAEQTRVYKPDPEFWRQVSSELKIPLNRDWWHVSAYADYDLNTARELGLTCVFIERPHSRPGPHDLRFESLLELAQRID